MRRGTTPTIHCVVTGADMSGTKVYATIEQGGLEIDVNNSRVESTEEGCIVTFTLTQEQTLKLKTGQASIQIRWIDRSGVAAATPTAELNIDRILKEGEIEYA